MNRRDFLKGATVVGLAAPATIWFAWDEVVDEEEPVTSDMGTIYHVVGGVSIRYVPEFDSPYYRCDWQIHDEELCEFCNPDEA